MGMKKGEGFDSTNRKLGDGVTLIQQNNAYSPALNEYFVVAGDYKVKRDSAPFITYIFNKHGDIVKDCVFSKSMRWAALEVVRAVYKRLESASKMTIPSDLKEVYIQLDDLERAKVDVGWLYEKLDFVYESMETAQRDAKVVCELCKTKFERAKMLHQVLRVDQSVAMSDVDIN